MTNNGDGTVTKLPASDGANQGTSPLGAANPARIAFDGANMWVACGGGQVVKLRASDGMILTTVNIGPELRGIAFYGAIPWMTLASMTSSRARLHCCEPW